MEQNEVNSPVDKTDIKVPSLNALACPQCKGKNLRVLGIQGSRRNAFVSALPFGMISAMDNVAEKTSKLTPMEYKCEACGTKFEAYPFKSTPDEILDAPCTVNFHRLGALTGMAVPQLVWLNGVCMKWVANKQSVTFQTFIKHNVVVVTDHCGVAFKGHFTFEAKSGGTQEIKFKRKFIIE